MHKYTQVNLFTIATLRRESTGHYRSSSGHCGENTCPCPKIEVRSITIFETEEKSLYIH